MIRKKLFALLVGLVLVLGGCGNKTAVSSMSETGERSVTKEEQKYIDSVLERDIFMLKDVESFADAYETVPGATDLIAYRENWKFKQLLNEKYFKEINWTFKKEDSGAMMIFFTGKLNMPDEDRIELGFFQDMDGNNIKENPIMRMVAIKGKTMPVPDFAGDLIEGQVMAVSIEDAAYSAIISSWVASRVDGVNGAYVDDFGESSDSNNVPGNMRSSFTDSELRTIATKLGVPKDINVGYKLSEAYYDDSTERWLISVSVMDDNGIIAGASVDAVTMELVRDILPYDGGGDESIDMSETRTSSDEEILDSMYAVYYALQTASSTADESINVDNRHFEVLYNNADRINIVAGDQSVSTWFDAPGYGLQVPYVNRDSGTIVEFYYEGPVIYWDKNTGKARIEWPE